MSVRRLTGSDRRFEEHSTEQPKKACSCREWNTSAAPSFLRRTLTEPVPVTNNRMKRIALVAALAALFFLAPGTAAQAAPADDLVASLAPQADGLRTEVLRLALESSRAAAAKGLVPKPDLLTVIDYSIPSTKPRLFTFDLKERKLLFREHVAHGVNSGGNVPTDFSNHEGSRQTSLGLFVTDETYVGANGYSLRLDGLERGVNDMARARAIVVHGAPYVDAAAARKQGRLGRSWGCPAVRAEIARTFINTIRGGSAIFAYYPDRNWLASSRFLGATSTALAGM